MGVETEGEQPVEVKVGTPDITDDQGQIKDARWDEPKARTMADVLVEGSTLSKDLEDHYAEVAQMQTPEGQAQLEKSKQFVSEEQDRLARIPEGWAGKPVGFDEEVKLTNALAESLEGGVEGMATASMDRIKANANKFTQPFEELYDRNPEHFAAMPTVEFMGKVKELGRLREALANNERWSDYMLEIAGHLKQALADKRDINFVTLQGYAQNMARGIRATDSETADKIIAVLEDTFSTSPESRLQQLFNFSRQVDEVAQKNCDATEAKIEAYIAEVTGEQPIKDESAEDASAGVVAGPEQAPEA